MALHKAGKGASEIAKEIGIGRPSANQLSFAFKGLERRRQLLSELHHRTGEEKLETEPEQPKYPLVSPMASFPTLPRTPYSSKARGQRTLSLF